MIVCQTEKYLTKKLSRKYHAGKQTLDDSLGIYRLEWELEALMINEN